MRGGVNSDVSPALETVIIYSPSHTELADFYQRGLDLGEAHHSPQHIGFQLGPVYLGFDAAEVIPEGNRVSLWFTVEDLQDSYKRLVDLGAEVRYPPTQKSWGGLLASLYDPDGNLIGLSQRRWEHIDGE